MVLTNQELVDLEKKYHNIICDVISSNLGRLINEMNSQQNMPGYMPNDKANTIETAAENIMNAMIARRLDWSVASMPGASDSCYECGDAIIHIDAKTIKNDDGDSRNRLNRIPLRQNQTSFDFENTHTVTHRSKGDFYWKPKLRRYDTHKLYGLVPNLTYILRVTWSDENLVEEVSIIAIPNGQFFSTHKSILSGIKVYPARGNQSDNIRFDINELIRLESWREKTIYIRKN